MWGNHQQFKEISGDVGDQQKVWGSAALLAPPAVFGVPAPQITFSSSAFTSHSCRCRRLR